MDYLDFEKNIKSTLSSSRKELNMDQLLRDLDIKPKQKTRRGFAYFSGLALLGLLLVGGMGLYLYNTDQSSIASNGVLLSEQTRSDITSATTMSTIDLNQKISEASIKDQNNLQGIEESEINTQTKNSERTDLNTISTTSNNLASPLNNINQKNIEGNVTIYDTNIRTTQDVQEVKSSSDSASSTSRSFSETALNNTNDSVNKNSTLETPINSSIGLDLKSNASINDESNREGILTDNLPLIKDFKVQSDDDEMVALPKVQGCPTFKDRNWSFSFLPEIGYAWPIKNLELNDPSFEDLYNARTFNEITLESFQIGGYLEMKHHSGLYLKTGVSYGSITEQMTLKQTLTIIDTVREVIDIIETPDSTIIIKGDVIYETEINKNNKVHYSLRSYDIPVAVGYSHLLRDFTLDFEAGVRFNVMTRAKGRIFTEENQFVELGDNERQFKRQVGLGVFAGLYIKKQLSEFGEVYLAPRFVFNTGPVSSDTNPIKQKYHSFGMHLGYVYTFAVKKL